jgi:hypothetical protein
MKMKKSILWIAMLSLALVVSVVGGELFVRFFAPQVVISPRWKYSEDYGAVLYGNARMIHSVPGQFEYSYSVNEYGYRGKVIPVSNIYERDNIVVLGDSYAFGTACNDGEEFPAVMQSLLNPDYDVINLSVGGYGLTQEIRRFYEFGMLFAPKIVILQFCKNDPADNLYNKVTEVHGGRFVFRRTNNPVAWLKDYLSQSVIQRSQLYNFFRSRLYWAVRADVIVDAHANLQKDQGSTTDTTASVEEQFYNELLEAFASDLNRRGIRLLMISVNGQLDRCPSIARSVRTLERQGMLEYVEIVPWFEGLKSSDYLSPEGHWGSKAHLIIAQNLARVVHRVP